MDPKLAEVYKTNQDETETDTEALATAVLAEKLAAAEDLDTAGMSDEEAEALASQILGDGEEAAATEEEPSAEEEAPAEEQEEEKAELSPEQEKVAEADYLGRVMAHAYVQERGLIEKKAAAEAAAKSKTAGKKDMGKVMEAVKEKDKKASAGKSKKASAEGEEQAQLSNLDRLALARAEEILKEHGIDPNAEEQEKKSSLNEEQAAQLAAKVEERAQAMIAEAGYELPAKEESNQE